MISTRQSWNRRAVELECLMSLGLSTRLVAERMGTTKNAVIGRTNRDRSYKHPKKPPKQKVSKNPAEKPTKPRTKRLAKPPSKSSPKPHKKKVVAKPPVHDMFPPPGYCVFLIGDFRKGGYFCGAPVAEIDMPYCIEHHRVTHLPPPVKKKPDI